MKAFEKKFRTAHSSPKISPNPLEAKLLRSKTCRIDPNVSELDLFASIFLVLPQ